MDVKTLQDEVIAKGKAQRGEFSPKPGSAPHKAYLYWLREGAHETPKQENFCHFWRVVVIWAPLIWLTLNVVDPFFRGVFLNPVSRAIGRVIGKALAAPFRFVNKQWNRLDYKQHRSIRDWSEKIVIGFLSLVALFLIGGMLYSGFKENWKVTLIVIGGVALGFAIFVGLCMLVGYLSEQHDKAEDARRAALWDAWVNDDITDDVYFGKRPKKGPGKVKRFFSGVVDFLVLLVQIVRVNKWKICPLVEIPKN